MTESIPPSEGDWARAKLAVERGWLTKDQLEAAVLAYAQDSRTPFLALLPLTPEQALELRSANASGSSASDRHALPPEVAEAMNDPKRRIGRFVRVDVLGKGGMGVVFRGWEPELRRWVALKFLKQMGDETARAYFKREAQLAAGLDHPNIAKIYEIGEHEGQPFIAMQFVDGAPLSSARKDLNREEKILIVRQIAEAVGFAHARRVIHRDLKPANVMLDKNGHVYVMDFGLAKETSVEGESLGGSSLVVGTPSYMAPEQAMGKADHRSDVYGIGAILYELVTGRPPFTGESSTDVIMQVVTQEPVWPRRLSPATPKDLEAIILRALEKDPKRRYPDAPALIKDLDAYQQGEPVSAAAISLGSFIGRVLRSSHQAAILENWGKLWMIHSLALLILCVGTGALLWQGVRSRWIHGLCWSLGLGLWAWVLWQLRRRGGPVSAVERQIAHVWAGSGIANAWILFLEVPLGLPVWTLAPIMAMVGGAVFLVKASLLSGTFYIQSAALFLTSAAMAAWPTHAMWMFGVVSATCFFVPGLQYYLQRRAGARTKQSALQYSPTVVKDK